ncbi:unnamed protein product, partial [Nesidiocoris tenuis]
RESMSVQENLLAEPVVELWGLHFLSDNLTAIALFSNSCWVEQLVPKRRRTTPSVPELTKKTATSIPSSGQIQRGRHSQAFQLLLSGI